MYPSIHAIYFSGLIPLRQDMGTRLSRCRASQPLWAGTTSPPCAYGTCPHSKAEVKGGQSCGRHHFCSGYQICIHQPTQLVSHLIKPYRAPPQPKHPYTRARSLFASECILLPRFAPSCVHLCTHKCASHTQKISITCCWIRNIIAKATLAWNRQCCTSYHTSSCSPNCK